MPVSKKTLRTCPKGHPYYKSSDCPVCPVCASEQKPGNFTDVLAAPAGRVLQGAGITTVQQLAKFSEAEILVLHGMGPGSLPKLRSALKENGLSFKK